MPARLDAHELSGAVRQLYELWIFAAGMALLLCRRMFAPDYCAVGCTSVQGGSRAAILGPFSETSCLMYCEG
jgi:hypothetical protein